MKNKLIIKAIYIGLFINLALALIKIIFGLLGQTQALFSDGLNALSDVFISVTMLFGVKMSLKEPDQDHPYGHEKFEGIAYFVLAIVFLLTAGYIIYNGVSSIINLNGSAEPEAYTVLVALFSIFPKLFLAIYYVKIGKKHDSLVLAADAKNHLLDVFSTLFVFIGLFLSQFGLVIFDYIAAILIGLLMLKLAFTTVKEAISFLVDQAPDDETIKTIKTIIEGNKKVKSIDDLKVRMHMTRVYVDVEIGVDKTLSLEEAHKIAETVHLAVEREVADVIHCMVHVNPK
ncbi:MAG: cation diffusion facilitator family transporter [Acholeplasmataceae bacterium]